MEIGTYTKALKSLFAWIRLTHKFGMILRDITGLNSNIDEVGRSETFFSLELLRQDFINFPRIPSDFLMYLTFILENSLICDYFW